MPGQFAALCGRLHLTGHGITAPPARGLPEPWLTMLAHDRRGQARTAPAADGGAAAAVALPDLDGITLAILGLHNCLGRTVVHMHASGPMNQVSYSPAELYYWPVTWIRDSGGRWHATRTLGRSGTRRDRAARGGGAAAEPRHDRDRGHRHRAFSRSPRQAAAALGVRAGPDNHGNCPCPAAAMRTQPARRGTLPCANCSPSG